MRYEGLNQLRATMEATCVLSKDFQSTIWWWVLKAVGEAHEAGKLEGRRVVEREVRRLAGEAFQRDDRTLQAALVSLADRISAGDVR